MNNDYLRLNNSELKSDKYDYDKHNKCDYDKDEKCDYEKYQNAFDNMQSLLYNLFCVFTTENKTDE